MMRIVGKGTFGKVFQVMHRKTKKIYAMKCIRKDVVLENEQMDSLKLEKEILYSIEHPFIVGMDYVFEAITPNLAAFQTLMETMLAAELGIDRYMTYIATRRVKSSRPNLTKLAAKNRS